MSGGLKPSIFQQFIEANERLVSCYENIDTAEYKKMNVEKQADVCTQDREMIKTILKSN